MIPACLTCKWQQKKMWGKNSPLASHGWTLLRTFYTIPYVFSRGGITIVSLKRRSVRWHPPHQRQTDRCAALRCVALRCAQRAGDLAACDSLWWSSLKLKGTVRQVSLLWIPATPLCYAAAGHLPTRWVVHIPPDSGRGTGSIHAIGEVLMYVGV